MVQRLVTIVAKGVNAHAKRTSQFHSLKGALPPFPSSTPRCLCSGRVRHAVKNPDRCTGIGMIGLREHETDERAKKGACHAAEHGRPRSLG